jgi:hypothetical protein
MLNLKTNLQLYSLSKPSDRKKGFQKAKSEKSLTLNACVSGKVYRGSGQPKLRRKRHE